MTSLSTLITFLFCIIGSTAFAEDVTPISILLKPDYAKTHKLDIDGKILSGSDAITHLDVQIRSGGRDRTVIILCSESLRLSDVSNVTGLITKAGFSNLRWFLYVDPQGRMNEFKFAPEIVPFSRQPK